MMSYQTATIHYLSGTGNSRRAATWVRDEAAEAGAEADLVSIREPNAQSGQGEGHLAGIVYPTHGFCAPWPVIRWALRMPRGNGAHALVLPTRGGTKFGGLFLPGLEGTGGYLPTQRALDGGHYSALIKSNWVGPEGGQMLVDETVAKINEMFAGAEYERAR
jgi:hypothetical protein